MRPPHSLAVRGARRAAGPRRGSHGVQSAGFGLWRALGVTVRSGSFRVWGLHFNATRTVLSEQRPIPVAGRLYALRLLPDCQWAMHLTHYHSMILVMKNGITK